MDHNAELNGTISLRTPDAEQIGSGDAFAYSRARESNLNTFDIEEMGLGSLDSFVLLPNHTTIDNPIADQFSRDSNEVISPLVTEANIKWGPKDSSSHLKSRMSEQKMNEESDDSQSSYESAAENSDESDIKRTNIPNRTTASTPLEIAASQSSRLNNGEEGREAEIRETVGMANQAQRLVDDHFPISPSMMESISMLTSASWNTTQQLDRRIVELDAKITDQTTTIKDLRKDKKELRQNLKRSEEKVDLLQETAKQTQDELKALRKEIKALKGSHQQAQLVALERCRENESLQESLKKFQHEAEGFQNLKASLQQAELVVRECRGENELLQEQLKKAQLEAEDMRKERELSLKASVQQAEVAEQVRREENESFQEMLKKSQLEAEDLHKEIESLQERLQKAQLEAEDMRKESELSIKASVQQAEVAEQAHQEENALLQESLKKSQLEAEDLHKEIKSLNASLLQAEMAARECRDENEALQESFKKSQLEAKDLHKESELHKASLKQAELVARECRDENESLQESLKKSQLEVKDLQEEIKSLKASLQQAQQVAQECRDENESLTEKLKRTERNWRQQRDDYEEAKKEHERAELTRQTEIASLMEKLEEQTKRASDNFQIIKDDEQRYRELENELDQKTAEMEALQFQMNLYKEDFDTEKQHKEKSTADSRKLAEAKAHLEEENKTLKKTIESLQKVNAPSSGMAGRPTTAQTPKLTCPYECGFTAGDEATVLNHVERDH